MRDPRLFTVAALLIVAVALLPFARSVEIPMGVLSIIGVVLLGRRSRFAGRPPWRDLALLYGAFALPMLVALVDAVAPGKSTLTTLGALRYPLSCAALLAVYALAGDAADVQRRLLHSVGGAVALLLALWCLDGLLQFTTGKNVLGYGLGHHGYVNGLFGEDDIKLGLTVALLMPIAVLAVLRCAPAPAALVYLALLLAVIALSGKRAAWIVALVELALLLVYYWGRGYLTPRRVSALALVGSLVLLLTYTGSDWVRQRSDVLLEAVRQPDYASLNRATSGRVPIWMTASRMLMDNPVNGVGPRGFRFAYADYATEDDFWVDYLRVMHAHQLVLDIGSETGAIGLLGYAIMLGLLWRLWRGASAAARSRALPYAVSLSGLLFPVNTHEPWYSSWSALLLWLVLGLYLFAIAESPASPLAPGEASAPS